MYTQDIHLHPNSITLNLNDSRSHNTSSSSIHHSSNHKISVSITQTNKRPNIRAITKIPSEYSIEGKTTEAITKEVQEIIRIIVEITIEGITIVALTTIREVVVVSINEVDSEGAITDIRTRKDGSNNSSLTNSKTIQHLL
jgi:hypothetical protein